MKVVTNEDNELISTRTMTRWQIRKGYCKLNATTKKDHFFLPFIDQMLVWLASNKYYYFLDGYSEYNQINIALEEYKTTFTCPYNTFTFRRMPFGLCNVPGTFQKCMMAIFSNFLERSVEIFMHDFLVFGNSYIECLNSLEEVLKRYEETCQALN